MFAIQKQRNESKIGTIFRNMIVDFGMKEKSLHANLYKRMEKRLFFCRYGQKFNKYLIMRIKVLELCPKIS